MRPLFLALVSMGWACRAQAAVRWSFSLSEQNGRQVEIGSLDPGGTFPRRLVAHADGIDLAIDLDRAGDLVCFQATAVSPHPGKAGFFSLTGKSETGSLFSYAGEETAEKYYRQSPHHPGDNPVRLVKQAIPMIGLRERDSAEIAVSDSPVFSDNYTTQWMEPGEKTAVLSSGDSGNRLGVGPSHGEVAPYFHNLSAPGGSTFRGIIFTTRAAAAADIRRDVLRAIAQRWGTVKDRFGVASFATNYMLVRKNETGRSDIWVVPGIPYANKQYSRDAFWQSMVLPPAWADQCYKNEEVAQSRGAERPLFLLIWAWRTRQEGGEIDPIAINRTLDYVEAHTRDGKYYAADVPGKKDFQSWFDTVAFEQDDVLTYNQGLLAVALAAAEKLGLHPRTSSALAAQRYREMFNEQGGYFPLSEQKDLVAVDALVGDVVAQVVLGHPLLPDSLVARHFAKVTGVAKTPYGYKVVCLPDGGYAPRMAYDAKDFAIKSGPAGTYQWGGSWFLYDMLFLASSYLHHVPGAETEIIWRGTLEFRLSGTTAEYINTATGVPDHLNQGWNAAVYAIWTRLMKAGLLDDGLLHAIDDIN